MFVLFLARIEKCCACDHRVFGASPSPKHHFIESQGLPKEEKKTAPILGAGPNKGTKGFKFFCEQNLPGCLVAKLPRLPGCRPLGPPKIGADFFFFLKNFSFFLPISLFVIIFCVSNPLSPLRGGLDFLVRQRNSFVQTFQRGGLLASLVWRTQLRFADARLFCFAGSQLPKQARSARHSLRAPGPQELFWSQLPEPKTL